LIGEFGGLKYVLFQEMILICYTQFESPSIDCKDLHDPLNVLPNVKSILPYYR